MIDFSKAYSRADFVNYLRRDFLPDDFEQEERYACRREAIPCFGDICS